MLYGSFQHGWIAVGTSPVQLTDESVSTKQIVVKSSIDNTAPIYVGDSPAVTADKNEDTGGFELSPGESLEMELDNTQRVYGVSMQADQMMCWIASFPYIRQLF